MGGRWDFQVGVLRTMNFWFIFRHSTWNSTIVVDSSVSRFFLHNSQNLYINFLLLLTEKSIMLNQMWKKETDSFDRMNPITIDGIFSVTCRKGKWNRILIIDFVNPINHELYITRSCAKQISNIVAKCGNNLPYLPYTSMYCF